MAKRYRFRFKTMDVYQAAVEHFAWTVRVVGRLPKGPFVIPNQIVSASLSIVGNVGEANGREKQAGEVEQHYRYAQGSTFESASYLDVLSALEVITDDEYNTREDHLARVAAMLTRLMQSARRKRGPRCASGADQRVPESIEKSSAHRAAASKSREAASKSDGRRPERRWSAAHDDPDR